MKNIKTQGSYQGYNVLVTFSLDFVFRFFVRNV